MSCAIFTPARLQRCVSSVVGFYDWRSALSSSASSVINNGLALDKSSSFVLSGPLATLAATRSLLNQAQCTNSSLIKGFSNPLLSLRHVLQTSLASPSSTASTPTAWHTQYRAYGVLPEPYYKPKIENKVASSMGVNTHPVTSQHGLKFGKYGVRTLDEVRTSEKLIETCRRLLKRVLPKGCKLWVMMNAWVPLTKKPVGIRMGKGKGAIDGYVSPVRPGQIIFEFDNVSRADAYQAMVRVQHKYPVRLGFVEWT